MVVKCWWRLKDVIIGKESFRHPFLAFPPRFEALFLFSRMECGFYGKRMKRGLEGGDQVFPLRMQNLRVQTLFFFFLHIYVQDLFFFPFRLCIIRERKGI